MSGRASAEGLVSLGDPRGLTLLEQLSKTYEGVPQIQGLIRTFQDQLRKKIDGVPKGPATGGRSFQGSMNSLVAG